jgi:hypothetical protein
MSNKEYLEKSRWLWTVSPKSLSSVQCKLSEEITGVEDVIETVWPQSSTHQLEVSIVNEPKGNHTCPRTQRENNSIRGATVLTKGVTLWMGLGIPTPKDLISYRSIIK